MILLLVSLVIKESNPIVYFLDLFLTLDINNQPKFRVFDLPITKLTLIKEYDPPDGGPPPGVGMYHLSTFADIGMTLKTLFFV
jgi:hypothetical protein